MVQDLIPLLSPSFFAGIIPEPTAVECENCSNPAAVCEECNEKELDDLRDDLKDSENEVEDLEKRIDELEKEIETLKGDVSDLEAEVEALTQK